MAPIWVNFGVWGGSVDPVWTTFGPPLPSVTERDRGQKNSINPVKGERRFLSPPDHHQSTQLAELRRFSLFICMDSTPRRTKRCETSSVTGALQERYMKMSLVGRSVGQSLNLDT